MPCIKGFSLNKVVSSKQVVVALQHAVAHGLTSDIFESMFVSLLVQTALESLSSKLV